MTDTMGGWHNGRHYTPEEHAAVIAAAAKIGMKLTPLDGVQRHTDVHTEHCCWRHGCKFEFDWHQLGECTVEKGVMRWQSFPCAMCKVEIAETWELAHLENETYDMMAELRHARLVVQAARNWVEDQRTCGNANGETLCGVVLRYNEWLRGQS